MEKRDEYSLARMIRLIHIIFFTFLFFGLNAQALTDNARIHLLTCSPGSQLYNLFGHSALQVVDDSIDLDIVFNYGIFDFDTPGFYIKFLRGQLPYSVGIQRMDSFQNTYKREKRSIYQQELNLSPAQVRTVYDFLLENYKPENRFYKYDFFFDNCSTRLRDIFDKELSIQYTKDESDKSYRNILDEYLNGMPWSDFGIDLIIGSVADEQATMHYQMFIPDYLHDHVGGAHLENTSFVPQENLILDYIVEGEQRKVRPVFTPEVLFGIFLIIELILFFIGMKNGFSSFQILYHKLWFALAGTGGLLIAFMWFGTEHMATKSNWNLLWLNPLYALIVMDKFYYNRILRILLIGLIILAVLFAFIIPQQYHLASYIIMGILGLKLLGQLLSQRQLKN